jgi:hypothetical protein
MTRWIIDDSLRSCPGVEFARAHLARFDLSDVEWVRIDLGRDRAGRAPQGCYGRCWYPVGRGKARKGYRVSCQVPGPFPRYIPVRRPPIYTGITRHFGDRPDVDTARIFEIGSIGGRQYWDVAWEYKPRADSEPRRRGDVAWWTNVDHRCLDHRAEAVAWIIGHESFHFLRDSRQVGGRNTEIEADAAGDAALTAFRQGRLP